MIVLAGSLDVPDEAELAGLSRARKGVRLACRAQVIGPVTVRPLAIQPGSAVSSANGAVRVGRLVAGVDLGTTTVAAVLVDPETGCELARASVANRQQAFGADVVARLSAAAGGHASELRSLAERSVCDALDAAARAACARSDSVERLVVAANSVMTALLVGADTASLATFPFVAPALSGSLPVDSVVAGALAPGAEIIVLPPIAGFVGGDALAATIAAGMADSETPILLVDFGTNAEIVLAARGTLTVASAAAGPAFEGVGITCGGPAAAGAITRLRIGPNQEIVSETLGDGPGEWFSGSGLVSAIAALVRVGAIDSSGRLSEMGLMAQRVTEDAQGVREIGLGTNAKDGPVLSQLDIRQFQIAKAAVRVGIDAVLAAAAVPPADLERVSVAGALGTALEPDDLVMLGVLPTGVSDRIVRAGNAALDGAAAVALDPSLAAPSVETARDAVHVELAQDPGFARALVDATELSPYGD